MKFTVEYPSDVATASPEFREPAVMRAVACHAEALGFDAIALAEHPAPSAKWRRSGGHDTFDRAVALGFFAAATTTIRLMTHLYVLPFHNPYLAAKALTSLDIVSGGRLIAGVGAGYLRSEFAAVGVEFDHRTKLFDESLVALRRIWTHPEEPVTGSNFAATGELHLDTPIQMPHPPLWIGATASRRCDAWSNTAAVGARWWPLQPWHRRFVPRPSREWTTSRGRSIAARTAHGVGPRSRQRRNPGRRTIGRLRRCSCGGRLDGYVSRMTRAGATWILAHVDAGSASAAEKYLSRFAEHFGVSV